MPVAQFRKKLTKLTKTPDLTGRQREMLGYMLRGLLSGYLPSYRELGEEMGISSPNGITGHIKALGAKEYVSLHPGQGYQLTDKAIDLVL